MAFRLTKKLYLFIFTILLFFFFTIYNNKTQFNSEVYALKVPNKRCKCYSDLVPWADLSLPSRAMLGDIFSHLNRVERPGHSHLSSWLPGLLCLVEEEDGVETR